MKNNGIQKIYSLLGIGRRANLIRTGDFAALESVKKGSSYLVICSEDASENTQKKFKDKCNYYDVELIVIGEKEELGKAVGKELVAVVSVNDPDFADAIMNSYRKIT
jgi:ribosomal protein L7Ae-like RNA K-turn-binding protein